MYEIELKAHVDNRADVIKNLDRFASFCGAVEKFDTYYSKIENGKEIRLRIRKEVPFTPNEIPDTPEISPQKSVIFTYKRKEIRTENGKALEVNDEKECLLSESEPFEAFLQDTGFQAVLTKHKTVLDWQYDGALFELCTVEKLGDFMEIEIMSETNDDRQVEASNTKLLKFLSKCGIDQNRIEKKYYSELLAEKGLK